MIGKISIRDPKGNIFPGIIEVPGRIKRRHRKTLYNNLTLIGTEGSSLPVNIYSGCNKHLECITQAQPKIAFWFPMLTDHIIVTGKDFDTGKFAPWTCSFKKQKNEK